MRTKGPTRLAGRPFKQITYTSCWLKVKACTQLSDASPEIGTRRGHSAEERTVHVSRWIGKLGVVKCVEEVPTQLQPDPFGDRRVLVEGKIGIVDARPVKEVPTRIADGTQRFSAKCRRIEIFFTGAAPTESVGKCLHVARIGESLGWSNDVRTVIAAEKADHRRALQRTEGGI